MERRSCVTCRLDAKKEGFSHEQLCMIFYILCYNCLTEAAFLSFIIYHFNRVYNDINYIISCFNSNN